MNQHLEHGGRRVLAGVDDGSAWAVPAAASEFAAYPYEGCFKVAPFVEPIDPQL